MTNKIPFRGLSLLRCTLTESQKTTSITVFRSGKGGVV